VSAAAELGVAVIGVGQIGAEHARRVADLVPGMRIVGVTDADPRRGEDVASRLPGARAFATTEALIGSPEVDAVLVTSPGETHEACVLACIAAEKPVFCEKPLATTVEACQRILDAEQAKGRRFVQVGFMRRYDPAYRQLRHVLATGGIGEPLLMHCVARSPAVPPTFTSEMMITDAAIHELDLVRWLFGEEIVATTVLAPRRTRRAHAGLQDPLVVVLELAGGILVDVELHLNAAYGYDIRGEVVCEEGTVALGDTSEVVVARDGARRHWVPGGWKERFARTYDIELQAWGDAVVSGSASGPTAWDGYAAAVAAEGCLRSLRTGSRCELPSLEPPALYATHGEVHHVG
jgi:myo-inositol 2-dehydrogenase / D-chiro-inositol 1-dehydrogenase